jgi:hypothetical protein
MLSRGPFRLNDNSICYCDKIVKKKHIWVNKIFCAIMKAIKH